MDRSQVTALVVSTQPLASDKLSQESIDPLAPIAGKSTLRWVVDAAVAASIRRVGVLAHMSDQIGSALDEREHLLDRHDRAIVEIVEPRTDMADSLVDVLSRLGPDLSTSDRSLVLIPAEAPHIEAEQLRQLVDRHHADANAATLFATAVGARTDTVVHRNDDGDVTSIHEVAVGGFSVLVVRASLLIPAMRRAMSAQWNVGVPLREIAGVLEQLGHRVAIVEPDGPIELITTLAQRRPVEAKIRARITSDWVERGVIMADPAQVLIDARVQLGKGVRVLPGSVLEGDTVVADGVVVGPNTHLIDATIGTGSVVAHCVVRDVEVDAHTHVTPFSVLG